MMKQHSNLLICGATMVTPTETVVGDCRITDGVIAAICPGGGLEVKDGEQFVDGTGLHLIPGCIDPQVHFREPGHPEREDIRSGSAAAASGGVTAFLDMPNNKPAVTTMEAMQKKLDSAERSCVTHYGFFIGATPTNVSDLQEAVGTPAAPHSVPGICGIKVFMGSSTGTLLVSTQEALDAIFSGTAGLIAVHAEDEDRLNERFPLFENRTDIAAHAEWRDSKTALLATQRAVALAQKHGHRLHILHLTSGLEADWLNGITSLPGEQNGCITTEALPQHLTFDETDVEREGTRLKMNPPIRTSNDRETLWDRLRDGTIQCMATDHAPHLLDNKKWGFPKAPSGMPGVETSLSVMLNHAASGRCTLEDVVRWMSTNVATCYGMTGKGSLQVGMDGDVVLVDLSMEIEVTDENTWSRVGWNPFRGLTLKGWPVLTVVSGVPVFTRTDDTGPRGRLLVEPGAVGDALIMTPWARGG
jgi:dihydroorotase